MTQHIRHDDPCGEFEFVTKSFELALNLKGATELDRGASSYQEVATIIRLRNGLMHFKPEWFSAQVEHANLSKLLPDVSIASRVSTSSAMSQLGLVAGL